MALEKCGLHLDRSHKELTPHGTPSFPCAGYSAEYGQTKDSLAATIPWHWHKEIELLYIADGSLLLQLPGRQVELNKGESYFINSNILHEAVISRYCILHSMVFHPLLVTGGEHTVFAQKYVEPVISSPLLDGCALVQETEAFQIAFEAMRQEGIGYELAVRESLSRICLAVFCQNEAILGMENAELSLNRERMRRMLDFIHMHYAENIALAEIAKTADIGERECLRCFQRMVQDSPVQYLIKYRVTQAAVMLQQHARDSIADISLQCGFDSPSHFSQMFKRHYQCTPREYRKRLK